MSAQGVAVLLSWLSCCGWAIWRYSTNSPNYLIFSTRSTITLEYKGTVFSEWSVPETCSVKNKSSPKTEMLCSSPGFQTIKPIVKGRDLEEERYLYVTSSNTCFMWYYKIINVTPNLTQTVTWIYDPENASPSELRWNTRTPSLNSMILSKQMAALGQRPVIYTLLKRQVYLPLYKLENGAWVISVPVTTYDVLQEIKGNNVAFQDCFVSDSTFVISSPWLTIPEIPDFVSISSPQGSQLISDWDACAPASIVVVADMETYQTNDSFLTWTRVRVPPNILTLDERHSVSDVILSQDGIFFLIHGILYLRSFNIFARLGKEENLPEGGIIGIATRKWCWIRYFMKAEQRSSMAIWTRNEVYLGYTSLKFSRITTTENLKKILNIPSAATLTIHNVEYTGHPLELALLLNYCVQCNVIKKIHLVIYNEDIKEWTYQDFALDVPVDSFLNLYFLYSAMPELILWDKKKIYYCYHNFTDTGVLQMPTEFGNLTRDSNIHGIYLDYQGNIVVKLENNVMFFFKINIREAVKLHLWTNKLTKSFIFMNTSGLIYLIYIFKTGKIYVLDYPLALELRSVNYKTKEECPFMAFHYNIFKFFYILDKGQNLSIWSQIVYPENMGLHIIVELYGPNILKKKDQVQYEITLGYCTKTMTLTFFQNINYEAVDDYFNLQYQNTGLLLLQVKPSKYAKTCPMAPKVFQLAVGCDTSKHIVVKGFKNRNCLSHDFFYIIEKSYLRNRPSKNLRVKYSWKKYGCPLRLDFREKFHPLIQLYDENGFVEDVKVNFIVWEIHGRDDYSFNNTMEKSGCLNEAQTWKSMTKLNKHLPLEEVWGPENYKHCFSYAIGKPGDLNQPYEIINRSNYNHLIWPMHHTGMYVFRVKILDPNYSFCNLTTIFAIEIYGLIPSPNGYLVFSFLFLLILLFFSILIFSYFHYMRIYKQYIYEPIYKTERKQKKY